MNQYIAPRTKLNAHLDRIHAIRNGGRPAPVNVEIDLSNRCSLGCSWCHFAYTHTKGPLAGKVEKPAGHIDGGDLMEYGLAIKMLEDLRTAGVKSITWTGGGEPTLHPSFLPIVTCANGFGFEQGIYSHGGHMDAERAAYVKEHFTWAFISLDECTPETYKQSKGVNRFEAACEGIRNLVAAKGKATVGVGFLLHPGNWQDVHKMVRLGKELGVDYVQFRPAIQYEQSAPDQLAESTVWVYSALAHLNCYKDDPFVIADQARFEMYRDWAGHDYNTCYWSALQTVITPNGKVWRCANKREHADALLGDLTVDSFEAIWQRSGGPCAVNETCRIMCRGHIANAQLQPMMAEMPHSNFI